MLTVLSFCRDQNAAKTLQVIFSSAAIPIQADALAMGSSHPSVASQRHDLNLDNAFVLHGVRADAV